MKKETTLLLFILLLKVSTLTATVDTVSTYAQLKAYSGLEDTVYVDHSRYFGLFYKDSIQVENHGTIISAINHSWVRITNNYSPRFWAIGGASPDNIIGPLVITEADAINSAAFAAYSAGGDTIEIDTMYTIDRAIFLITNNTYLGTSDSSGFIRINSPKTVLTHPTQIGDRSIKVQSNLGFRTRQKINIANDQLYDSIARHVSYTASVSNALGGDSIIFLSGRSMQKAMKVGDSIGLFFPMMSPRFTQLDSVHIKNLVFDGNRKSYNLNYDWRVNTTISLPTTNQSMIEDCRFYEIPTENIFLCGSVVRNCSGKGFNGSAIHFSCNNGYYPTQVFNNTFTKLNEIGDSVMNHSEAGLTFSSKVRNLRVAYNRLDSLGESGVGVFFNDDYNNEITDNLMNTDKLEVDLSSFYTLQDSNVIYNNKNLNKADTSTNACILKAPEARGVFPCMGNSSLQAPLVLGDTVSVKIDSLWVLNSNENFVKSILPILDTSYFSLKSIQFDSMEISSFHQWKYDSITTAQKGLVFDNGHESGLYGIGNWGFEKCGENGGCDNLSLSFLVSKLPPVKQAVSCPIKGLEIRYDGEVNTWDHSITCNNQAIYFDSLTIGSPILDAQLVTDLNNNHHDSKELKIYPNPANDFLRVEFFANDAVSYRIINMMGAIQKEGRLTSKEIALNGLSNGLYLLELSEEGNNYQRVFIKSDKNE